MASDPSAGAPAAGSQAAARAHGYHTLRVKRVVRETDDARSFVLDVPAELEDDFCYRAGQFCTFRVHLGGEEHLRSYSMSSAPQTDRDLTVTVKRVPGGRISNWLIDHVSEGDRLETTRPAGVFCLTAGHAPVVAFCGGSGVTPVMSIAKAALSTTPRSVKLVYANRSRDSVIFDRALDELRTRYPGRLDIHRHFDSDSGFLDRASVARLASAAPGAEYYICGPGPFMDLVSSTLVELGVGAERILLERFVPSAPPSPPSAAPTAGTADRAPDTVTIVMKGRSTTVAYHPGDTLLETARRGALQPPFSCESGSCATCMAMLREGAVTMRVNNALSPDEVAEGWILTCQAVPSDGPLTVEYGSF